MTILNNISIRIHVKTFFYTSHSSSKDINEAIYWEKEGLSYSVHQCNVSIELLVSWLEVRGVVMTDSMVINNMHDGVKTHVKTVEVVPKNFSIWWIILGVNPYSFY